MKKDPIIFIDHIIECADIIERYIKHLAKSKFLKSREKHDAVIRRIEIIGEATKHIPKSFKDKYPDIPWKKIAGMRDMLIHEYFGVDLDLTWNVAKRDVPLFEMKVIMI